MNLIFTVKRNQTELHAVTALQLPVVNEGPVHITFHWKSLITTFQNAFYSCIDITNPYLIILCGDTVLRDQKISFERLMYLSYYMFRTFRIVLISHLGNLCSGCRI